MAGLDLGDDLVPEPDLIEAALGGEDQLRSAVVGVGPARHVAELLELVDDSPDDLLVAAREPRELRRPDPVLVQIGENSAVPGVQIVITGLGEAAEELVLQGEEQSSRQNPEIWIQLLA